MARVKVAAGYVRCSTEMQEDSPEQQKKEISLYAQENGYHIVEWFVDFGKSGTTFDQRPEFQRMRSRVENDPHFESVICYDESRWGRAIDPEENTYMRVLFRKHNVDVVLVKTSVDRDNEFAPMLSAFEGVQASQYSKKLSELTLRGAKNNSIYSNGGTAPYGYQRCALNTKTGSKRLLLEGEWCISGQEKVFWVLGDRSEMSIVKFIFEERAKGKACVLIAKNLNDRLVPCPRRGRWKTLDQKWSAITIKTIIENRAYYGTRVYNRNSMSKILARQRKDNTKHSIRFPHWKNDQSEWVIVDDAHEPIIAKELWEKANSFHRNQDRHKNGYSYHSEFLLTGLLRCSYCGFGFQGWSGTARGIRYRKYIDSGWQNKRVCGFLGISKDRLETFAIEAIKNTLSDPKLITEIEQRVSVLLNAHPHSISNEIETLNMALTKNEVAMRNLTQAIERGAQIDLLLVRLEELEAEKKGIESRLNALKVETRGIFNVSDVSSQVADFIANFEKVFQMAPIEERKILVKKCISQIIVDRDKKVVRFFIHRIPSVIPQMDTLLQNKKALTVVSAQSSGGRT